MIKDQQERPNPTGLWPHTYNKTIVNQKGAMSILILVLCRLHSDSCVVSFALVELWRGVGATRLNASLYINIILYFICVRQ